MSLPVGIGLAGLGRWGRNYSRTLLALPECRLVAMADPDPAALAVLASPGIARYDAAARLFSDPAVEAVVIATPDRTHYALAAAALIAGRDVLVEKPMSLASLDAESLVERAESGGRILAVGHTAVYETGFTRLAGEMQASPLKSDRRATAVRTSAGYTDGRSSPIVDLCPHDVAMAVLLFGTPSEARAREDGTGVEYGVRFAQGASLEGRVEWRKPPHDRRFSVAGAVNCSAGQERSCTSASVRDTPLGRQCLDFIESCRTRRRPLSDGRLGLSVVRCLNALGTSARDGGGWLPVEHQTSGPEPVTDSELRGATTGVRT